MIRFKVVKASHLLLGFAVIALAVVIALILFASPPQRAAESAAQQEAKAVSAFASNPSELMIEIVRDATPAPSAAPRGSILIYHTHTHEAYRQVEGDPYVAVEAWRTTDSEHSVVRVGDALANALENLGYAVVHDVTDHEQDELSTAYERSLKTLEGYEQTFDLIVDLHRDAYSEGLATAFTDELGREYAQLMLLVGRGDNYLPENKPDYEGNLRFAQSVSRHANELIPGICRNVTVKVGRYNQHMGTRAILAEVGHNENTLAQALSSVDCLAKAIDAALSENNTESLNDLSFSDTP